MVRSDYRVLMYPSAAARGPIELGIDFGTSHTVAILRRPSDRERPLLFDGSPLLPSAVFAAEDGGLVTGRDALRAGVRSPGRLEPNPKRRIDEDTVLLGTREYRVVELFAAVLARVREEAVRVAGSLDQVRLTVPATWGPLRRRRLAEAAAAAGLPEPLLAAEPVAAAAYFTETLGKPVPTGSAVVIADFGAGTFDVSVVAATADGFDVLAVAGRDDIGGLDLDTALVDHLGRQLSGDPDWQRLARPQNEPDRRQRLTLLDEVRLAKEQLSRQTSADILVPLLDLEVHLTRDELERLASPLLEQTVEVTEGVMKWVGLAPGRVAGVFLVGGASRIPLVATLLHRALGEAPVVIEQPELVVAEGSLNASAALLASGPAAPGPTAEMRLPSALRALQLGDDPTVRVSVPASPATTVTAQAVPPARFAGPAANRANSAPLTPTREMPRWTGSAPLSRPGPPRQAQQPDPPAYRQPAYRPPPPVPSAGAPVRRPRRRGAFVRFLQAFVITLVLIVLPVTAAVLAYGIGSGKPPQQDMVDLGRDIARLIDRELP